MAVSMFFFMRFSSTGVLFLYDAKTPLSNRIILVEHIHNFGDSLSSGSGSGV